MITQTGPGKLTVTPETTSKAVVLRIEHAGHGRGFRAAVTIDGRDLWQQLGDHERITLRDIECIDVRRDLGHGVQLCMYGAVVFDTSNQLTVRPAQPVAVEGK